jgi:hypothetical protein
METVNYRVRLNIASITQRNSLVSTNHTKKGLNSRHDEKWLCLFYTFAVLSTNYGKIRGRRGQPFTVSNHVNYEHCPTWHCSNTNVDVEYVFLVRSIVLNQKGIPRYVQAATRK